MEFKYVVILCVVGFVGGYAFYPVFQRYLKNREKISWED